MVPTALSRQQELWVGSTLEGGMDPVTIRGLSPEDRASLLERDVRVEWPQLLLYMLLRAFRAPVFPVWPGQTACSSRGAFV